MRGEREAVVEDAAAADALGRALADEFLARGARGASDRCAGSPALSAREAVSRPGVALRTFDPSGRPPTHRRLTPPRSAAPASW